MADAGMKALWSVAFAKSYKHPGQIFLTGIPITVIYKQ